MMGQGKREGLGQQTKGKVHWGVGVFISLTKFTDRGAEVEARRCSEVTGHRGNTEEVGGLLRWEKKIFKSFLLFLFYLRGFFRELPCRCGGSQHL